MQVVYSTTIASANTVLIPITAPETDSITFGAGYSAPWHLAGYNILLFGTTNLRFSGLMYDWYSSSL